jgi:putative transposase
MSTPRQIIPGRTYLVTRRVTQRQFLLRPGGDINEAFPYLLGVTAARFGISVHGWIVMSNHIHYLVTDHLGNLPAFLAFFHGMLARLVNSIHGRWENMWASEPTCAVWLIEAADRFDKLIYVLTNPVKDHLVERASDWPGPTSFEQHMTGVATTFQRPRGFFRDKGPMLEEVTLRAEKLPGFEHLSDEEWARKIGDAVADVEASARAERIETRRPALGREGVLRAAPTDTSSTPEPRRNLRPHLACLTESVRRAALWALRAFRRAHREARKIWLTGDHTVVFPLGTYAFKLLGACCDSGPPG